LEEIKSNDGKAIAIVIKKGFKKDGINFVSQSQFPLQVGVNSYKKGDKIKPHVHRDVEITIKKLQEVLYIKSGEIVVSLYNSNRELFKSFKLTTGDLVFLIDGGHGFEMLKDTTIIEVKQGPYFGKDQDKALIE
jgi:hypothetical protein